jgi:hypothetical protein
VGDKKFTTMFVGKPEGKDHSENLGIDGRILLKWILERLGRRGLHPSGSG